MGEAIIILKKKQLGLALLLMGLVLGVTAGVDVSAQAAVKVYHQTTPALKVGKLRNLKDRTVHYVKMPKTYVHGNLHSPNQIRRIKGAKMNFKTKYLLPYPGYKNQAWGNPQSLTTDGRYFYVIYCPTNWKNRGRVVRYDKQKLDKMGATPLEVQTAYTQTNERELAIRKAVKVGPAFTTGHGQSLAYDWKHKRLYMWIDKESAPRVPMNRYGYIAQISGKSLAPIHKIRFKLKSGRVSKPGGHVLTFDRYGNAFFWTKPTVHTALIYKGTISRKKVHFRMTNQLLTQNPGTRLQSMAYNPHNKRLYLVADDSIASFPAKSLVGKGSLKNKQFKWTEFSPKREFEGLTFTKDGTPYLLTNHHPELFVGDRNWW